MSGLTTHVLDLTHGRPASNVKIELYHINKTERNYIKTGITNMDGRLDHPLLTEGEIDATEYELVFHIGDYFRSKKFPTGKPPFLESVPVRFGVSDTTAHYHVPLLVSPWGYQVYRGS